MPGKWFYFGWGAARVLVSLPAFVPQLEVLKTVGAVLVGAIMVSALMPFHLYDPHMIQSAATGQLVMLGALVLLGVILGVFVRRKNQSAAVMSLAYVAVLLIFADAAVSASCTTFGTMNRCYFPGMLFSASADAIEKRFETGMIP